MRSRFIGRVEGGAVREAFATAGRTLAAPSPPADGSWVEGEEGNDGALALTVLAAAGSGLAELYSIAAERGPSPLHSPAALAEAARLVDSPGVGDPSLEDLTGLPLVTIDEATSRDLDQALFVEPSTAGGFRVWYAIADASWGVRPGTALFAEALSRGATFYLPGLILPMLPPALSEGVISLNPHVERRAMVFEVELDEVGGVLATRLHRARVKSCLKTHFDAVQGLLDGSAPLLGGTPEISRSLQLLREVGERRIALAEARHIVQPRRRELAVRLGEGPERTFVAFDDARQPVERYNEQISLLCNVEGARFLAESSTQRGVQPIFRYHQPPAEDRLEDLTRQISGIVRSHGLDPGRWGWSPADGPLADYLQLLPSEGDAGRIARAIHRQAMLSGGRSGFASTPAGHYGVGAEVYARFTAPMREIVGIFVHKEAWEAVAGEGGGAASVAADEALRDAVLVAAQRAKQRQQDFDHQANRLVLDQLFGADLALPVARRPQRRGTVLGLTSAKLHVQLDELPVDVKVYVRHLARQLDVPLRLGRDGVTLRRRSGVTEFAVGDGVELNVLGEDRDENRWELALRRRRE